MPGEKGMVPVGKRTAKQYMIQTEQIEVDGSVPVLM
jgi:hypothetical protein